MGITRLPLLPSRGFTLIELLVAIFILLIVMLGVNQIFTTTGQTVGATQALSELNRTSRAMQATMTKDFGSVASDGPAFIIRGEQYFQYRNQADYLSDPTNTVPSTADFTNSGTEVPLSAALYNSRSHRMDRIGYFTRQLLHRQTGNDGTYMANQAALEQWLWYGHLAQPDNTANPTSANFYNPGQTKTVNKLPSENPNNFYSSQWLLGREAINLVTPDSGGFIYDSAGTTKQNYIGVTSGITSSPLAVGSNSTTLFSSAVYPLEQSRYDLAGVSMTGFKSILQAAYPNNASTYNFWTDMMCGQWATSTTAPPLRYYAVPFTSRPITSLGAAQTSPIIGAGVSQFIVEYAGDFISQTDNNSAADGTPGTNIDGTPIVGGGAFFDPSTNALTPVGQDGKIDFVVQNPGTANAVRSIRWYGMPRSTSGLNNGKIQAIYGDVCPLRDTIQQCTNYSGKNAPFEKLSDTPTPTVGPTNSILGTTAGADYLSSTGMGTNSNGYYYNCAWGPSDTVRPKLIRIVMTLEDSNNRLADGQTFEYVFELP